MVNVLQHHHSGVTVFRIKLIVLGLDIIQVSYDVIFDKINLM